MTSQIVRSLNEAVPNFVSFNDSQIDQTPWERVNDVEVIQPGEDGNPTEALVTEASLFSLLRSFIAHASNTSLMGSAFLENNPMAIQDIAEIDQAFRPLALNIPSWVPIPSLGRARRARQRLQRTLSVWEHALDKSEGGRDPGVEWSDLDDVSPLMLRSRQLWAEAGVSPEDRAASDMALLFALNSNASPLSFWLLLRILAHGDDLVSRIRTETAPFVNASQPPPLLQGMSEPSQLKIDAKKLSSSCPLLKSCYLEALRLHSAPLSLRHVHSDCILPDGHGSIGDEKRDLTKGYLLKRGDWVAVPHSIHHTDPRLYRAAANFEPERFMVTSKAESSSPEAPNMSSVDQRSFRPFGSGVGMCPGRLFAETQVLAVVASLLALWNFEPIDAKEGRDGVKGGRWRIPRHVQGDSVFRPESDIRVRIRRREISPSPLS
ncbi:MAG: hypothetical protein M4579_003303 [Chaenotheca gracillima]|nr:MAG: hypothetical protein M4579_003303 [Chaenotheca gracillima]